jgi:hypothetical protein
MLRWDGSHIGTISSSNILSRCIVNNRIHMKISLASKVYIVKIIEASRTLCCIVDELKILFGVKKNGTHIMTVDRKDYIIVRQVTTARNNMRFMYRVSDINVDFIGDTLINRIRRVILFREIIGLSSTFESNIHIIGADVYSTSENNLVKYGESSISNVMNNNYFEGNISYLIRGIIKIEDDISLESTLFNLRYKIESIIERVDRTRIDLVDHIMNRITYHLLYSS